MMVQNIIFSNFSFKNYQLGLEGIKRGLEGINYVLLAHFSPFLKESLSIRLKYYIDHCHDNAQLTRQDCICDMHN